MHWSLIETQLPSIDGLSIRFAESEDRDDHPLLLSPWPESLFAAAPPVLLPIPGTSTVAHLEENLAAALIELTPDQVQQLDIKEAQL